MGQHAELHRLARLLEDQLRGWISRWLISGLAALSSIAPALIQRARMLYCHEPLSKTLLAAVVFLHRRLEQDQALLGRLQVDARLIAAEQRLVILLEVVAEQREAEAALALERAVAGAAGAADLAHQRQHVLLIAGLRLRAGEPLVDGPGQIAGKRVPAPTGRMRPIGRGRNGHS